MCGIFGFYLNRKLSDIDIKKGRQYLDLLNHRGPDNTGFFIQKEIGLFLGHKRLSIIDVTNKSNQPMKIGEDTLVYNGEIYNYLEIRKELAKSGEQLLSAGDTEILLRSWKKWGIKSLNKLDGMYAFALFSNNHLNLVTDPFGEKPLYYINSNEGIYFSSEPKPLVEMLNLRKEISSNQSIRFILSGHLDHEDTGYKGLKKIPPATHISINRNLEINKNKYWRTEEIVANSDLTKNLSSNDLDDITNILIDSIKIRLRSDVPKVLFLSSGVDSSLIASIISKEIKNDILSLTVGFKNQSVNDESIESKLIAKKLKIEHITVNSEQKNHKDVIGNKNISLFDIYGEPIANLTAIPSLQMSLIAKKYAKVAISGIGGDEIFFGYNRYENFYKWRKILNANELFYKLLSIPIKLLKKNSALSTIINEQPSLFFYIIRNYKAWHWLKNLSNFENIIDDFIVYDSKNILSNLRLLDLNHTMPNSFIPAIERSSMKASIEVRTPFLSRKLFEKTAKFHPSLSLNKGPKTIQKMILSRFFPEYDFSIPKQGFNSPINDYLISKNKPINIPGLKKQDITHIWNNKDEFSWSNLALRISVLDEFISK